MAVASAHYLRIWLSAEYRPPLGSSNFDDDDGAPDELLR